MLGTWRIFLSLCVFVSHIPLAGLDLHIGVMAVICFFFVSGYLMSMSYGRFHAHCGGAGKAAPAFFLDRAIKIFPAYWLTLGVTYYLTINFGSTYIAWQWVSVPDTTASVIRNIIIFPLNYFYHPYRLGPVELAPAWSLASELQFYLFVPLLWAAFRGTGKYFLALAALASCGVMLFNLGFPKPVFVGHWLVLHEDYGGYRPFWTMIFVFILGLVCHRHRTGLDGGLFLPLLGALGVVILAYTVAQFFWGSVLQRLFPRSMLISLLVFLPVSMVFIATLHRHWSPFISSMDRKFGLVSYPVFLTHMPALLLAEHVLGFGEKGLVDTQLYAIYCATAFAFTLAMAVPVTAFAVLVDRYRIGMRGFDSLSSARAALPA